MTTEELTRKFSKAVVGGAQMMEKINQLEDLGVKMMGESNPDSEDFRTGSMIVGFAKMMDYYYDQMFES